MNKLEIRLLKLMEVWSRMSPSKIGQAKVCVGQLAKTLKEWKNETSS